MLTIVTGNPRKFEKITSVFPDNFSATQQDLDIIEIQSMNVDEVSADKAKKAFDILQIPILVEDTAIYFTEYDWFPGPFAKQAYQSLWRRWIQRLLWEDANQEIKFRSVVSYMDQTLDQPISFFWESVGVIDFSFPNAPVDLHVPYMSFFRPLWADEVASMRARNFDETHHRVIAVKKFVERFSIDK